MGLEACESESTWEGGSRTRCEEQCRGAELELITQGSPEKGKSVDWVTQVSIGPIIPQGIPLLLPKQTQVLRPTPAPSGVSRHACAQRCSSPWNSPRCTHLLPVIQAQPRLA